MFLKVYCSQNVLQGDVLHFNTSSEIWEKATGIDHPICVARTDATSRNTGYSVEAVFADNVNAVPVAVYAFPDPGC